MRNHNKAKLVEASQDLVLKEEGIYSSKIPQVCLCSYQDVDNGLTQSSLHIFGDYLFLTLFACRCGHNFKSSYYFHKIIEIQIKSCDD